MKGLMHAAAQNCTAGVPGSRTGEKFQVHSWSERLQGKAVLIDQISAVSAVAGSGGMGCLVAAYRGGGPSGLAFC